MAVYAIRTLPRTIEIGLTDPGEAAVSDTIKGADMIVKQLKANDEIDLDVDALGRALDSVESFATPTTTFAPPSAMP